MRIRKHYDRLTPEERQRFVQALLALKDDGRYDQHVRIYQRATCWARRGPAFLPWHRHLLLRFEEDLRSAEPDVTLPYWDFCRDRSTQSSLWDEDFMGGDGRPHDGMVITGPFATEAGGWPLLHGGFLVRRLGQDPVASTLPTAEDLEHVLSDARYDVAPWDSSAPAGLRNRLEGWVRGPALHNRVHAWVGGVMARDDAPDDPLFWLVHAFVDKLWSDWQRRHPGAEYQPAGEGPPGHNLDDAFWPWNGGDKPEIVPPFHDKPLKVRPRDLLDHRTLGYAYDTDPEVSDGVFTTLAVGEEGPQPTTLAVGEEGPQMTTLAVGEEGPTQRPERVGAPRMTTLMLGEEDQGRLTTLALGEEDARVTTLALGEESPRPVTLRWGEDPQPTTLATGEEDARATTLATGEEEPPPTTLMTGEEDTPRGGPFGRF